MTFNINNTGFYLVKISAIYYVGLLFGIISLVVSALFQKHILNKVINTKKDNLKSTARLGLECIFIFGTINTLSYILKNMIEHIKFPLNGVANFDYSRLKELSSGGLITIILINTCKPLLDKMSIISNRLMDSTVV